MLRMHHEVMKEASRIQLGATIERTDDKLEDLDLIMKHYPIEFSDLNKYIMKDILSDEYLM